MNTLAERFTSLYANKDDLLVCELGVYTVMGHAITVIIHTYNGETEIICTDSLGNSKFTEKPNISTSISVLTHIASHKTSYADALTRGACLHFIDKFSKQRNNYLVLPFIAHFYAIKKHFSHQLYEKVYKSAIVHTMKIFAKNLPATEEWVSQQRDVVRPEFEQQLVDAKKLIRELGI